MEVMAQVSIYPLRQEKLSPAIEKFWEVLEMNGVRFEKGPMSTLISGDSELIFRALEDAFEKIALHSEVVMVFTLSNACAEK
jgi:uncharacterized protein YqgV (UPF0045/DUF77 family)